MTAVEFAEKVNTAYPTVAKWLRDGKVPGAIRQKIGNMEIWMIPVDVLKDFVRPKMGRPSQQQQEMGIFRAFASVFPLHADLESARSEKPPLPDISCKVDGKLHYFELGRVLDPKMAKRRAYSLRTGKITGGSFSQDKTLIDIVKKKSDKNYNVPKESLDLLIYYDEQIPSTKSLWPKTKATFSQVVKDMTIVGKWNRIWCYDHNSKQVLFAYPGLTKMSPKQ